MPRSEVTHVRVDNTNVITHIGFGGQAITKASAVQWIELGLFSFYTNVNGVVADVVVMPGNPKYLRSDPDKTSQNNLLALTRF